ncbi:MAG: leucine-rich repeat domain-containing protein [Oscillospiraceae bacterium]|nr:leucine-rich repeat domain-containing protein [Oscillospiraceae bacterium]
MVITMKKRGLSMVLAIAMVVMCLTALSGCDSDSGNTKTGADTIDSNNGNAITENSNKTDSREYFMWSGTEITGLTEDGKKQKHISIPADCTSISAYAFMENEVMEELSFLGEDTTLNKGSFSQCTALVRVVLPAKLTEIPESCFFANTALESVEMPQSLVTIGEKAFMSCDNLDGLTLGDSLVTIGESAFAISGISELELPEGLKEIGKEAFSYCSNLTEIRIPESVETIGVLLFLRGFGDEPITVYVKEGSYADKELVNDHTITIEYY